MQLLLIAKRQCTYSKNIKFFYAFAPIGATIRQCGKTHTELADYTLEWHIRRDKAQVKNCHQRDSPRLSSLLDKLCADLCCLFLRNKM